MSNRSDVAAGPLQIGRYWLSRHTSSPNYCATWYDPATRQTTRRSLGTSNLEEAELQLAEFVTLHGKIDQTSTRDMPLAIVFIRWYEREGKGLISSDQARIALDYWNDFFDESSVSDLTPERQNQFIKFLSEKKKHSERTVRRVMAVGQRALRSAVERHELDSAPEILLPGGGWGHAEADAGPPKGRPLLPEELALLFDTVRLPHLWTFMMLGANTLSRPRAALDATTPQYDQDFGLLNLNPPGRRQTRKWRPIVPVTETLKPVLALTTEGHFVNVNGRGVASVRSAWETLRNDSRLQGAVNPYSLRHTVAQAIRRKKVPKDEISIFLGHAIEGSSKITEGYAPFEPTYARQAADAIDEYLDEVRRLSRRKLEAPDASPKKSLVQVIKRPISGTVALADPAGAPADVALLQITASSFRGWPIEIAVALPFDNPPTIRTWLVKPHYAWDHALWSVTAERAHGISRAHLEAVGQPARDIALDVRAHIGDRLVLSEYPPFDTRWLEQLFRTANIPNVPVGQLTGFLAAELATPEAIDRATRIVRNRWSRDKLPTHRAPFDAEFLTMIARGCLELRHDPELDIESWVADLPLVGM